MFKMAEYSFVAGILAAGLALVCHVLFVATSRLDRARASSGVAGAGTRTSELTLTRAAPSPEGLATYGTLIAWLALAFISASLVFRAVAVGHGPFANMYEFSIAFAWGILAAYLYFERRYHPRVVGLIALSIALAMLLYATTIPSTSPPLGPALQNNLLLTVHVAVAIVAYGTFSVAFAAAALYLIQSRRRWRGLPDPDALESISYRAVVIGFPFLTLVILLGAVWADVAWGSYWSWDPKETASLVTWLIYGAYLHARVVRSWRESRSAWLLVAGFAATLFTYFGNLFLGGLHSYSGLS